MQNKILSLTVMSVMTLCSVRLNAASGTIQTDPDSPWLGLRIEGEAAQDLFEQIKKSPGGDYSMAREVKDAEQHNILCSFDGRITENAWCVGTLLTAPLDGSVAVSLFQKLPTYDAKYRFGERESIWRKSFMCVRSWIRSNPSETANTASVYRCDTDVAPNGDLNPKKPAMVGVLN